MTSPALTDIAAAVRDAGIVGAGGAGFPTHVKLANRVDTFIANGAECEPILEADRHAMLSFPDEIVRGTELVMGQVGAEKGVIAVKEKNGDAIDAVRRSIAGRPNLKVEVLGNYYPAGDEMVLVRQVTGRIVPIGGLPFHVGVTVGNVATLRNIAEAACGKPVTTRIVTVGGEVRRPVTVEVPVGTRIGDLISHAGGAGVEDFAVIVGGPVMGPVGSVDGVITKTGGGVVVLPSDHTLLGLKGQPIRVTKLRAKMCCTCRECTILCPRNALGHPISPAKMMSYSWHIDEIVARIERGELDPFTERMVYEALLCCQCGVCELYACIFGLSPNKVYALVVDALNRSKFKVDFNKLSLQEGDMFEYRKLSAATFARKLGLERYLVHTEFESAGSFVPRSVRIPLLQHIGAPAVPVVAPGDTVRRGDLIGEIPEGKLGARVHASIDGRVTAVTGEAVSIEAS